MPRSDKETESQRADREAVERFTATPEFKARAEQRRRDMEARIASDPVFAQRVAAYRSAAAPILTELHEVGVDVEKIQHLQGLDAQRYKIAEPVILRWLAETTNAPLELDLASSLHRKEASSKVAPVLVLQLHRWRDEADPETDLVVYALAGVLAKVITEEVSDEACDLASDANFGSARMQLALALGKVKNPRAVHVLLGMFDEPELAPYAATAMGHRREPIARSRIEKLLKHPEAWVRKEAQKALKRIPVSGVSI